MRRRALQDHEIVDAGLTQSDRHADTGKAATDDHDARPAHFVVGCKANQCTTARGNVRTEP